MGEEFARNGKYASDDECYIFVCTSIDGDTATFTHGGEEIECELHEDEDDGSQYAVMGVEDSIKFGGAKGASRCICANKEVSF